MRKTVAVIAMAAGIGLVGSPAMAQEAVAPAPAPQAQSETQGGPDVQPMGTTCIQNCGGYIYSNITGKTSNQSFTYSVGFNSVPGVGNARMQVRMLDSWGNVVAQDNHYSPAGYRHNDSRVIGRSYVSPVSSVCHTLWEGGTQLGTACAIV